MMGRDHASQILVEDKVKASNPKVERNETTYRSVQVGLSALQSPNANTHHWFRVKVNRPGSSDGFDVESSSLSDVRLTEDDLRLIAACCEEAIKVRDEVLFGENP